MATAGRGPHRQGPPTILRRAAVAETGGGARRRGRRRTNKRELPRTAAAAPGSSGTTESGQRGTAEATGAGRGGAVLTAAVQVPARTPRGGVRKWRQLGSGYGGNGSRGSSGSGCCGPTRIELSLDGSTITPSSATSGVKIRLSGGEWRGVLPFVLVLRVDLHMRKREFQAREGSNRSLPWRFPEDTTAKDRLRSRPPPP